MCRISRSMCNGVAACVIVFAQAGTPSGFGAEDPKPGNSISPEATLEHAETLIRQGQFLQAAGELNAALESSPDWIP